MKYADTSEEVATTFSIPVQAVAGSSLEMSPVVAEVTVTEPPTPVKLAALESGPTSPVPDSVDSMYSSASSTRVTTPTSPNQVHSLYEVSFVLCVWIV